MSVSGSQSQMAPGPRARQVMERSEGNGCNTEGGGGDWDKQEERTARVREASSAPLFLLSRNVQPVVTDGNCPFIWYSFSPSKKSLDFNGKYPDVQNLVHQFKEM